MNFDEKWKAVNMSPIHLSTEYLTEMMKTTFITFFKNIWTSRGGKYVFLTFDVVQLKTNKHFKALCINSQSATAPSAPAPCEACRRLARFARHYPWRSPPTHTP